MRNLLVMVAIVAGAFVVAAVSGEQIAAQSGRSVPAGQPTFFVLNESLGVGKHYVEITVTSSGTSANVIRPVVVGGGTTPVVTLPDPDPIEEGTLAHWVDAEADKISASTKNYEGTRDSLASMYIALAKRWDDGEFKSVKDLMDTRGTAHETLTTALKSKVDWESFDAALIAELNRRQVPESELSDSWREVGNGLAAGKAINPKLIMIVLKIVINLKNPPGLAQAIGELIDLIRNR